jgi:hypothetical protein
MVADGVVVWMLTVCAEEYVPPAGLKVGAAVGRVMVYAAEFTGLAESPAAMAMAAIVSVAETVIGPEYTGEPVVGVAPLVV